MKRNKSQEKRGLSQQAAGGPVRAAEVQTPAFELARALWVEHQATMADVSAAADTPSTTLEAWRREFGWDEQRREAAQGWAAALVPLRRKLVSAAEELVSEGSERNLLDKLKEIRSVIDSAVRIRHLDRDIDYRRYALRFWRELQLYLEAHDMEALRALEPHIKPFTHQIARG